MAQLEQLYNEMEGFRKVWDEGDVAKAKEMRNEWKEHVKGAGAQSVWKFYEDGRDEGNTEFVFLPGVLHSVTPEEVKELVPVLRSLGVTSVLYAQNDMETLYAFQEQGCVLGAMEIVIERQASFKRPAHKIPAIRIKL